MLIYIIKGEIEKPYCTNNLHCEIIYKSNEQ